MKLIKKHKIISLSIVSVVCGLIWRGELEFHGWHGLKWVSYFHYSVPVSLLVFLLWASNFLEIQRSKKLWLLIALALSFIIGMYSVLITLKYTFITGPMAMVLLFEPQNIFIDLYRNSAFFLIPFLIFLFPFVIKKVGLKINYKNAIYSLLGILVSAPLALIILFITNHKGGTDLIHTIKSGFVIPFLVFSLGILFLGINRDGSLTKNDDA